MKNYIKKPDILKWYIYKILLIMRLTTVILMVSMLQVSAATVAQEFNYVKKGASLIQIFKEIKKQTGYNIIWNEKKIDVTTTIDANFKKATIQDVLNKCLSNLPLSYSINDKMVMIKEDEPSFRDKVVSFFSAIDVRGRVVDEKGIPLVGATVKVKGTKVSTLTNANGEFLLKNVNESGVLLITYLGFESKEMTASENVGTVILRLSIDKLPEVEINAGYYTITDRERTGNINKITAATIEKQPISNPLMALQGRVPGLQVIQQTGIPGGGFTVQIRGKNSVNKQVGNDPLYLIDGVAYPSTRLSGSATSGVFGTTTSDVIAGANPLSYLNPNDIESIEILKDADATAIYGSRGANGVILITTKKRLSESTRVNAGVSHGYSQIGHHVDLLNTSEYISMRKEAFKNDDLQPISTDYDVNGTWDPNRFTDWQEEFIGGNAATTNITLNIAGGSNKSSYLIGASRYNEGTVFPGDLGFNRTSIRSSVNLGSNKDRFSATFTFGYSFTDQNLLISDLTNFIFLAPNAPSLYDEYGFLNYTNNTLRLNPFSLLLQPNDAEVGNLMGSANLSYNIFKNFVFKTSVGYTSIIRNEFLKSPLASYSPALNLTSTERLSRFSDNFNKNFIVEPQLSYNFKLGTGKIEALVGMSIQNNKSQFRTIDATGYNSDELMDNIAGAATLTKSQMQYSDYKYIGAFMRLNYSLSEKYYLNLTTRRDGSSRFGPDKQFANFGAIGAAWIFSEEKILKDLSFINFGKLRASYGVTGNDQIGNYGYLQLWTSTATYQGKATVTSNGRAPNPEFSWERNRKAEVALQLGFFKSRISLEISYYRNQSSNQLLNQQLPLSTGIGEILINSPATVQNTGMEIDGQFKILASQKLRWTADFNFTLPKNKLISYPELETSPNRIDYKIGEPLSILKVYNTSVDSKTGLYKIEDYNSSGVVDDSDRYLIKFLGQSYYGGVQNSFTYKNFSLDFLIAFAKQNGKDYRSYSPLNAGRWLPTNQLTNQVSEVLKRWQNPDEQTNVQRFGTTSLTNSANSASKTLSNLSVVDASYLRLKNASLTYAIPQKWISKIKLQNAFISIQGQNLFTLTNYVGLDPETQSFVSLPPLRTIIMALNVSF